MARFCAILRPMNIFLLRGLVREKRHWGSFLEKTKKAFPGANIITPEIPGVGEYCHIPSPPSFDEMIHFMREKNIASLQGSNNVILAMSLGGMLAKRWSELYPEDFQRIILVNTSFKGLNPLFHRLRFLSVLRFLRIFATLKLSAREKLIIQMVSNNNQNHETVLKEWEEIQKSAPVSRKSFINQIAAALSFNPAKERPKAPLLILAGKKDRLCSYKCSLKLREQWGGQLEFHPEGGHDLPIDDPEWIIEKMKTFCHQASESSHSNMS